MLSCRTRFGYALALVGFVAYLMVLMPATARAWIERVDVVPPHPTETDTVRISAEGYFPNLCWSLKSTSCDSVVGNGIRLSARGLHNGGVWCLDAIFPYQITCTVGPLAVGSYHVTMTEYWEPCPRRAWSPLPYECWTTREIDFDVIGVTAVQRTTWGRIRALYR